MMEQRSSQPRNPSRHKEPPAHGRPENHERQQRQKLQAAPPQPGRGQSWADLQDQKFKQPRQAPNPREPQVGESWADLRDQRFKQPQLTLDLRGHVGWQARQAVANDHTYRIALEKYAAQQPGFQVSKDDVREQRHGMLTKEYKDSRLKPFDDRPPENERDRSRSRGFERD